MWLRAYKTELDVVMILEFLFDSRGRMLKVRKRVENAFYNEKWPKFRSDGMYCKYSVTLTTWLCSSKSSSVFLNGGFITPALSKNIPGQSCILIQEVSQQYLLTNTSIWQPSRSFLSFRTNSRTSSKFESSSFNPDIWSSLTSTAALIRCTACSNGLSDLPAKIWRS